MKTLGAVLMALAFASPAAAQTRPAVLSPRDQPAVSIRPFALATGQWFTAKDTFDAVFGRPEQPFLGGGVEIAMRHGFYADVTVSQFSKTGQRSFVFNGQTFRLGIPLTGTITPVEVTAGYRLRVGQGGRVFSYAGAGLGSYQYKEASQFSDPAENIDTRHTGFLGVYGFEFHVVRWIGLSADVQYTHVNGILGQGGISQQFKETDLGGIAARLRIIVGK